MARIWVEAYVVAGCREDQQTVAYRKKLAIEIRAAIGSVLYRNDMSIMVGVMVDTASLPNAPWEW